MKDLLKDLKGGFQKGATAVSDTASKAVNATGEVAKSNTTQRLIGVAVDGVSDVVFSPAETAVKKIGMAAVITQSESLLVTHEVAGAVVGEIKETLTEGAKALLSGASTLSGEKLVAISNNGDKEK